MDTFVQFFAALPNTSQAALIGSAVTLLGALLAAIVALLSVLVTHRGNEKRLAIQLAHDREQKRIEREMELRRDVYLQTAEAIVAGINLIGRYADLGIPKEELGKEYFEKRGAIAKVHLIGREATVKALLTFNQELGSAVMRIALLRNPLVQMQARLKLLGDQIQVFGKERDRMVELMRQLSFDGNREEHRWTFVNNTFEFERKRVDDCIAEQRAIEAKLKKEWAAFATECFETVKHLSLLVPEAVRAVRDELEMPMDYAAYKSEYEANITRHHEKLSEFLGTLQKSTEG